jgi:hypothetical protein
VTAAVAPPGYTAEDLLRAAKDAGMPRSAAWLRSLVNDGLLDRPDKHGIAGQRGGRAPGTWPENQFRLFLALLDQMQKGAKQTATLCNVPVGLWLYFGPEYAPLRQVRRALSTYATQYWPTSAHRGRHAARHTARFFAAGSDMTRRDRERLTDAIVTLTRTGTLDHDALITAAGRIFDPEGRGREVGPTNARISPESWVRIIDARLTAIAEFSVLDDQAFEDARLAHHRHLDDYIERQPEFACDREVGAIFEPVTVEHLLKNACIDTLTILGFRELARNDQSADHDTQTSPPRPRQRPGGMAPGEDGSACALSVSPPPRAASP